MRPILLSLGLCLGLAGCLSAPETSPATQADVLVPGDGLRITVAGEEELSGGFVVNSDGNVRLELLGAVPAAGLSPAALQERLRQLLAAGYLKNPQVLVERVAPPPALRLSQPVQ
ncbi:MAG: polysaccharide biosynthesis/export family protein [Alphaproteobacteria bacterium]